jgi:hypothetical protein
MSALLVGGGTVAVVTVTITPFLSAIGNSLLADLRVLVTLLRLVADQPAPRAAPGP